jgi:activating signal cointegrator complex subunit 3
MGIHHAGMLRGDRKLSEQMFADGAIKVLCCTATLAWGVNLPAHSVVIKGTQVYNAEKGGENGQEVKEHREDDLGPPYSGHAPNPPLVSLFAGLMDLSILDVQQIFGRAGRPQFDTFGEAHLITSHASLPRYLNLLVHQAAIESNFIKQLADHLNAEVVGGTVCNISEAAQWLQYTYLYVRMLKNPMAYGIDSTVLDSDPQLKQKTTELVQNAAKLLDERRMLRYDPKSGNLAVTDHGRVASHFYIQNESVATFNELLARIPHASDADLMHVICNACEFVNVKVRQEELKEIDQLLATACPLAVTATADTSPGKSNILLQAFISNMRITSFTLTSDTNYIASNAGRVARALFEMCLRRGNAGHASKFLKIAKTIDKRVWWYHTPLRQFAEDLPNNIFPALESRGYGSYDYALSLLDMTDSEVGQAAHWQKGGEKDNTATHHSYILSTNANLRATRFGSLRSPQVPPSNVTSVFSLILQYPAMSSPSQEVFSASTSNWPPISTGTASMPAALRVSGFGLKTVKMSESTTTSTLSSRSAITLRLSIST